MNNFIQLRFLIPPSYRNMPNRPLSNERMPIYAAGS